MVIHERSFNQCAEEILKYLNKCRLENRDPNEAVISGCIYELMTRRDSTEKLNSLYYAYYKDKAADYEHHIHSLKFDVPARIEENPAWFSVSYEVQTARPRGMIGIFKVTHKEYFTFVPLSKEVEEVYKEIIRFVKALPLVHKELYPLNIELHDDIQLKIPNHLWYLLKHPDSLVIHYRNGNLSGRIREIVIKKYEESGVKLERMHRAESGFDFYNTKAGIQESHSQLISRVIAKQLLKHKENFMRSSVREISPWLKASMIEVSKWSIQQIYHSLY
jgi:ssDNA-specific exonuclease RecJ